MRPRGWLTITFIGAALLAGCGRQPTYPKAHLTQSLQELLRSDHVTANVRLVDHTLAVQVEHLNALTQTGGRIGLGAAFDDVSRKVLQAVHRILLSTDAELHFYVLLISDPKIPGAYLTMVRYTDDIRRAQANMLDVPEMFARTVFDVNFVGANILTLEQYVPRDIRLEEFLSWQLARRIQHALTQELQDAGVAEVGRCGGEFHDGEFAFTLNVVPQGNTTLDDETVRQVFRTSTQVVAKVLSGYHFDAFTSVRLIYPPTGRNLVLPKNSLAIFR